MGKEVGTKLNGFRGREETKRSETDLRSPTQKLQKCFEYFSQSLALC